MQGRCWGDRSNIDQDPLAFAVERTGDRAEKWLDKMKANGSSHSGEYVMHTRKDVGNLIGWWPTLTQVRQWVWRCLWLWGLAVWLALPGVVQAEAIAPTPPLVEPPVVQKSINLGADDISAEKVSQFVTAYLQVLDLVERREGELQRAETQLESLRVQQEIETDAYAIIKAAGLTRQEYLQLLGLANIDPEFGERVVELSQEANRRP